MTPLVPVSWGELIDKITILEIKARRIADATKRANVARELEALVKVRDAGGALPPPVISLADDLRAVNEALWEIEDAVRDCEAAGDFSARFVNLARSVYKSNDRRSALKRQINQAMGSELIEEKSYRGS
jgi:hypothetical protein